MSKPFSRQIGETLAHLQDLFDTAVHSLFKRGTRENSKPSKNLLHFFTDIGNSYYRKYTEIKRGKK